MLLTTLQGNHHAPDLHLSLLKTALGKVEQSTGLHQHMTAEARVTVWASHAACTICAHTQSCKDAAVKGQTVRTDMTVSSPADHW